MNTKTKFFETKDQYLNFRTAFAAAVNDPRSKKGKPDPSNNGYKPRGWMTGAHFMLLNVVRNFEYHYGFSLITAQHKLDNGAIPDLNINRIKYTLDCMVNDAKRYLNPKPAEKSSWWRFGKVSNQEEANQKQQERLAATLNTFLAPFGDTFTIKDLAKLYDHVFLETDSE